MLEARGEFRLGEVKGASWALSRRLIGFGFGQYALFLAALVVAELSLPWLADEMLPARFQGRLGLPVILVITVASLWGFFGWRTRAMARAWRSRGVSERTPTIFRIDDRGFVVESPSSDLIYRWPWISEILPLKKYWIFVVPGLGYAVPRRFFADQAAERAFLRAAMERMTEPARARSREAGDFIGTWG